MTKVLVPYDFSEQANFALDFSLKIGETMDNIHIEVLHVMELPTSTGFGTMGGGEAIPDMENQIFFIELMEKRKKQIADLKAEHLGKGYSFDAKIVMGNAFKGISASIGEQKPDLVIMGSKGVSGVEEVLIGSNTEKVVRTAPCPVITIKAAIDPAQIKKIVFASDFNNESAEVAARIKRLSHILDAQLYLVFVNTPGNFETSRESIERIRSFAKTHDLKEVKAEIYNSRSEESGIMEFAEDIHADMIAMTTHGRTGFLHLITGSIAEDVVNHAKRPVWTFKVD